MNQRTTQIGGSDRGPRQLDEAKTNQGLPLDNDDEEKTTDEALASGRTETSEADAGRRGAERTTPPPARERDPLADRKKL
jgi:hypothetical protein